MNNCLSKIQLVVKNSEDKKASKFKKCCKKHCYVACFETLFWSGYT